jgi:integrator complex subunit 9
MDLHVFGSPENIEECMQKIKPVKYGEEVCFNGILILKASSSGLELGNCVWTIKGPRASITYLPSSIFVSAHALDFDHGSVKENDVILFLDFSSLNDMDEDNEKPDEGAMDETDDNVSYLCNNDDIKEEIEKIIFICSCIVDAIKSGGSVLIPIDRLGTILLLLEHISELLDSSSMKVIVAL